MTGVILAGGRASRFSGENKSFLKVGGKKIINIQLALFKKLFDETIIVTNDCAAYFDYDTILVNDIVKGKGPLGGIYTALYYMESGSCFVAACDMPFLNERLISYMIKNIGRSWIYTIKDETSANEKNKRYEPLHSIYSKKCLRTVEAMIRDDNLKISLLFDELKAKTMSIDEARKIDHDLSSFKNINTRLDLENINEKIA